MTVDRIDNNGNYEPGNVRWASGKQQMRNIRRNNVVEAFGEKICQSALAERYGMRVQTVRKRIRQGFSPEDAVTVPLKPWGKYQLLDAPNGRGQHGQRGR